MDVLIEIYRNKMTVQVDGMQKSVTSDDEFTTERLLVGEFEPAVVCMERCFTEIGATGFLKAKPVVIIKPMDMKEGGLCAVERRVLLELGEAAGARNVTIQE